ncbi:putative indole-3-pyruvate monooxygenase [Seiridium unicorne]|uniref:Indole-3-pyruvate monooxygenase n=1 Tax=Seiridium unicorne TaxID=138068 RepID=A0ABR2UEZ2_9PEZI
MPANDQAGSTPISNENASCGIELPSYPLESKRVETIDCLKVAQEWTTRAESVLTKQLYDKTHLDTIFVSDGWLRDCLVFSLDLRTLNGLGNVQTFLQSQAVSHPSSLRVDRDEVSPALQRVSETLTWICAVFSLETTHGKGRAVARLVDSDGCGQWKAYCLYTTLEELNGIKEPLGLRRPPGGNLGHVGEGLLPAWQERRAKEQDFADSDPDILVIGAGQGGLSIAARLQNLGLKTLIIDKNVRVGDNWRKRYRTLVNHAPVVVCHMPYLPFPTTWPLFTPKDKLADWLEVYASVLELNTWMDSTINSAEFSDTTKTWTVQVVRGHNSHGPTRRTLHPRHIVMATGQAGEPFIPRFTGQGDYGGILYHTSSHEDASKMGISGKRVVVVGTGVSGHDVAKDFQESGADVTLLQRGGTAVLSIAAIRDILFAGAMDESRASPSLDTKDMLGQSLPIPLQLALGAEVMQLVKDHDATLLDGLSRAGFRVDFGADGSGPLGNYLTRGGGYYPDTGCSQLIIEGKIKVKSSPQGIKSLYSSGLMLGDGCRLEADVIVLATGYGNMRTTVGKILGDTIADKCKDVWDLDYEGELNAIWRPSGQEGFWYMGGNLALCRPYSKTLALQIKLADLTSNTTRPGQL